MPIKNKNQFCPTFPIKVSSDCKVVFTDAKKFPWRQDKKGYFLVKIEGGFLHCGFANHKHEVKIEFIGKNPEKMIKEIAKRKICGLGHMGYIASELMIAKNCLENGKKFVQR